jgi:hypothetical protein
MTWGAHTSALFPHIIILIDFWILDFCGLHPLDRFYSPPPPPHRDESFGEKNLKRRNVETTEPKNLCDNCCSLGQEDSSDVSFMILKKNYLLVIYFPPKNHIFIIAAIPVIPLQKWGKRWGQLRIGISPTVVSCLWQAMDDYFLT